MGVLGVQIEEGNEDEEFSQGRSSFRATTPSDGGDKIRHHHYPTPLHHSLSEGRGNNNKVHSRKKIQDNGDVTGDDDRGVNCNKCRPSTREKISVVPVDNNGVNNRHSITSPNGNLFKSIISSIVKKSPRSSSSRESSLTVSREEQWKIAATELSHKLIQATKKKDEAILEASRLKYSMSELEKKLDKLEIYCHNLKSGLEMCTNNTNNNNNNNNSQIPLPSPKVNFQFSAKVGGSNQGEVLENFLVSVSEARSSIRFLSRSLALQLRQMGGNKVYDRLSLLLQPYDIKISLSRNPRGMLLYIEALLNRAFFEDFESVGFQKGGGGGGGGGGGYTLILNPIHRCEANFASFNLIKGLTWDEVLDKGTRHFSEEFSKFCDRKMSEIVAMLGWNRAWPEQLLQSFFGASKAVWLVHLLANSMHPGLPIFRVDKGSSFDSIYMEDMGGDKQARKLVPTIVRIMVTPGFYVYDNVVKCKVLCRYYNNNISHGNGNVLTPSPT